MTEVRDSINFDARNRLVSDVVNRSYTQSPLSNLKARIASIKEQLSTVSEDDMVGQVIFARNWTMDQFKEKFSGNTAFIKKVTSNYTQNDSTKTIREYFVHIPEMTGMLPFPDFAILKAQGIASNGETSEDLEEEYEKQLRIVSMYPRFFMAADSAVSWRAESIGRFAKVSYQNIQGHGRGIGIFDSLLDTTSVK